MSLEEAIISEEMNWPILYDKHLRRDEKLADKEKHAYKQISLQLGKQNMTAPGNLFKELFLLSFTSYILTNYMNLIYFQFVF